MRNSGIILAALAAILVAGCATSLKSNWTDFRAYYNSYYNAKERFQSGLDALGPVEFTMDTDEWVRVYASRHSENLQEFEEVLEKTRSILRDFPESQWADDALYLRARSLYYLNRLYPSLQDFEKLSETGGDAVLRNESVLWKSRILYELQRHEEAISYLEQRVDEMAVLPGRNFRAEAKALLAEHYCSTGNLQTARSLLGEATSELTEGDVKSRAHLLFGQVLEHDGDFRSAYFAYTNVAQWFPDYKYVFWSDIKRAQMTRRMGETQRSLEILERLTRDDKSFEYSGYIVLERARTLEAGGQVDEAVALYREVLRARYETGEEEIRSHAWFRLGIIYSEHHRDFVTAAAWFDSASAGGEGYRAASGEDLESRSRASAYSRYANLRRNVQHVDSLLWLGSLPPAQRDSVLMEVRERRLEELSRRNELQSEQLYNTEAISESGSGVRPSALFGFLNHRNADLAEESRREFRAFWGARSLADNWRLDGTGDDGSEENAGQPPDPTAEPSLAGVIELDLESIPDTPSERDSLRSQMAQLRVSLGNLFHLSLQLPDSAEAYYRSVERNHPESGLVPRTLYSLYELYRENGRREEAAAVRKRLVEQFDREELDPSLRSLIYPGEQEDGNSLSAAYESIEGDSTRSNLEKSRALRGLALQHASQPQAPAAFYRGIERSIKEARRHSPPDLPPGGQPAAYEGALWDTVRTALRTFRSSFPSSAHTDRVQQLLSELQQEGGATAEGDLPMCEELETELVPREGLDAFMEEVKFPDAVAGMELQGEISYRFRVDSTGRPLSWELLSPGTGLGIEEALEEAFPAYLRFLPVESEGEPVAAACRFLFPLDFSGRQP